MKKKAVSKAKKSPKKKAKAPSKAKKTMVKAKTKSVKAKSSKAPKKAKTSAKPKTKAKPQEDHGLTVIDLFRMKQEREQAAAADAEAWKHKKDLPAQDQHSPEDAKGPAGKKSGFGGARHH